ncbi:caspase family protein [Phormidium sp. LEGE 05292]|uniref:caspase family protein n=1 Tax=[Phormidium] sp. LEGE 05292 TaxID=767427 RepID=UPI00187F937D|nr:caspase family protein [Phormidium sp. LEGE 05292]MBE9229066.1 caspase family protein [Phormidium sp. LEGE 05292]
MLRIKRRNFLYMASSALASLGLSQCKISERNTDFTIPLNRGSTNKFRRLALLVGINNYASNSQIPLLQGCLTDVELQRNLLIYHFGFHPQDILILTNSQATRKGILTAFEEHLIKQAKPEDVVVFHYSGHGSQIVDSDHDFPDGLSSTIVPFDSSRPANNSGGIVQDITGHTLFLLMSALPTENVTFVLDCCYSGGAKRGNLQVRAIPGGQEFKASPEELAYQRQWLSQLNLTPADFKQQRRKGVAKGVVITATNRDQLAADYPFNGFSAGAFTYLMSQYLWQESSQQSLIKTLPNIARSTTQISFTMQTPEYEVKPGSRNEQKPIYFIDKVTSAAEAVVTKIEDEFVEMWLGGIDSESLAAFDKTASFTVVDANNKTIGEIQLQSRQGLVGRGKLFNKLSAVTIQPGAFCLETVRGIPHNLNLKVGIDPSLDKDTDIAFNALSALPRIQVLPLQQGEVHCIFGRMSKAYYQKLPSSKNYASLPTIGSLGLFSVGGEVINGSFGVATEIVTDAINRLQVKLKSLLAIHIIKMSLNINFSRLNVTASLRRVNENDVLIGQVFPVRGAKEKLANLTNILSPEVSKLPVNTPVELKIINNESNDIFVSILVINAEAEITVIFPNQWSAPGDAARLVAGETLLLPEPNKDTFSLQTQEPLGMTEILIITSLKPLRKALKVLQTIAQNRSQQSGPIAISTPVEVIDNLLKDLGESSNSNNDLRSSNSNNIVLTKSENGINQVDTTQVAAMSITFEVV